ncbi:MAG: antibiotic biosynthesis monooxygenase [Deltaproteobacteria bacterium]|jgi:quinol monooxygenase YgiN|nr:antibiotic biosynthesis monooxygenase [Deltaproteobacteria bacterium]
MSEIRIVAELEIKAEFLESLMPALRALVEGSRAEPGNRRYDLNEDLKKPGHFFIIETWVSEEAIAVHNATPHYQAFSTAVAGKADKRVVTKLRNVFA